jgi:tetratricopeptide (TPR) repeat protein
MGKILLFALLFIGMNSFAQSDNLKLNRKDAIRLDSIGQELHKSKNYKEAIEYFNKALKVEPENGEFIYHRALSLANSHHHSTDYSDICEEFKKAMKYGAVVSKEVLFFYKCDYKK